MLIQETSSQFKKKRTYDSIRTISSLKDNIILLRRKLFYETQERTNRGSEAWIYFASVLVDYVFSS